MIYEVTIVKPSGDDGGFDHLAVQRFWFKKNAIKFAKWGRNIGFYVTLKDRVGSSYLIVPGGGGDHDI